MMWKLPSFLFTNCSYSKTTPKFQVVDKFSQMLLLNVSQRNWYELFCCPIGFDSMRGWSLCRSPKNTRMYLNANQNLRLFARAIVPGIYSHHLLCPWSHLDLNKTCGSIFNKLWGLDKSKLSAHYILLPTVLFIQSLHKYLNGSCRW